MFCTMCSSDIDGDSQYYRHCDMGPEITSTIKNTFGYEGDDSSTMCEQCFANIMQELIASPLDTDDVKYELQCPSAGNACVWCCMSLYNKRTHALPHFERQFVAQNISPRNVPDGSLICYRCWLIVKRKLQESGVDRPPETQDSTAVNANTCVCCLRSLAQTRRHSLPEGPERNEIISRIFPREIPAGGQVCYACWVFARRCVQKANNVQVVQQKSHHHHNVSCALCGMSLFRRLTHSLPKGSERDRLAATIYPRQLSGTMVCKNCWEEMCRITVDVQPDVNPLQPTCFMELDGFRHTTNSSRSCFVPECASTERLRVPDYLRKRILNSQKVFVTDNARVCNEHKSLYNWDFLEQHEFSNSFTKAELQSMLNLSVRHFDNTLASERIPDTHG